MPHRVAWKKIKQIVLHHILHVDDSPERIALGAALGVFVALTPTPGMQTLLAVALAALLGGNKAAAVPPVWITNPLTGVPIYWFNYKFGAFLLGGSWRGNSQVRDLLEHVANQTLGMHIFTRQYWLDCFRLLVDIGWPLWVGGGVFGLICAVPTYAILRRGIVRYRARMAKTRRGTPQGAGSAGDAMPREKELLEVTKIDEQQAAA
jgi:hypothetical protein